MSKWSEETKRAAHKAHKQDEVVEKELIDEYTSLAARQPAKAVYPWALGLLFNETDLARQESLCRQAAKLDPKFAQAYDCLAHIAGLRTSNQQALVYQRQAFELAPDDEKIAGSYAYMLGRSGNGDEREMKALLQRFPDSSSIARTLIDQANKVKPDSARIAALERLRNDASGPGKPVATNAAELLYAIYVNTDLAKAKILSLEMAGPKKSDSQWAARATYLDGLLAAQQQIGAGNAKSALSSLASVEGQKDKGPDKAWYLTQAKALDASGRTADAIAVLRDSFVAEPSDSVQAAMRTYGAKLGKPEPEIADEVWAALKSKAKPAPAFTLKRLDNDKPVSLADYRGRVVIVDFWYPNCGPCRASFPYLQRVAAKYKDKGLIVLAINGLEEQQDFALPYLRGMGYDFLGLKGNQKFAAEVYGVMGYPTTFLIGADGKIYLRPSIYDDAHERSAELAVDVLLRQVSAKL